MTQLVRADAVRTGEESNVEPRIGMNERRGRSHFCTAPSAECKTVHHIADFANLLNHSAHQAILCAGAVCPCNSQETKIQRHINLLPRVISIAMMKNVNLQYFHNYLLLCIIFFNFNFNATQSKIYYSVSRCWLLLYVIIKQKIFSSLLLQ